ncbi:cbb3-type cytochrome c oxidase subunit I [Stenotrophomonas maltophilia]|uniref:Cbb3-type cytochrome c oxidase subunit I n=1 Tax=Stenotrophomonas maltophilia TaxID=40324 RepID=A0AAI9FU96_STEMA|nr:cbb3-type cytochrome c oxidase subunit I [Stenotrophomonas maltophilia]
MLTIGLLLGLSFVVSLLALGFLIWAMASRQLLFEQDQAYAIFTPGEAGVPDDATLPGADTRPPPAGDGVPTNHFDGERAGIDRVSRLPVLALLGSGMAWLAIGSIFGLMASMKMHMPDWLVGEAALTFGRVRTLHLNLVIYGWLSMTGIGVVIWITGRMFHTALRLPRVVLAGTVLWNLMVACGALAIASGWTDGEEWLEIPWQLDIGLAVAGACFAIPLVATAARRNVHHIYVSGWYFLAALCWFPVLFIVANLPGLHTGVQEATVNWWFAHNVLGLWLTPLGVGSAYYFISRIIGKPIYSYSLSLIGFWGLALFYSQVGIHHLIGGPVPTWVVTLSIVHSVMMFIPVIAVAINQHVTVARNTWALKASVPLRFISLGALMYTAASFQGSLEALRSINSITHFTHYTVGHAHLGAYAFVTYVLFGAVYYMMPRITGREWPWPRMLNVHFWLVVVGFAIYFFALSIGGWLQGEAMLDVTRDFADSVILTIPFLQARTVGGALMVAGHFLFVAHFIALFLIRLPAASMPDAPRDTVPATNA